MKFIEEWGMTRNKRSDFGGSRCGYGDFKRNTWSCTNYCCYLKKLSTNSY